MTLAQRYGLVKQPPKLLTEMQWEAVHAQSQAREDSTGECCICREHFGPGEQVLLSCSHSFHRDCLASFERWGERSLACMLHAQLPDQWRNCTVSRWVRRQKWEHGCMPPIILRSF